MNFCFSGLANDTILHWSKFFICLTRALFFSRRRRTWDETFLLSSRLWQLLRNGETPWRRKIVSRMRIHLLRTLLQHCRSPTFHPRLYLLSGHCGPWPELETSLRKEISYFCYSNVRFVTYMSDLVPLVPLIPEKNSNNNMSHGPIKKKIRGMIRFRFLRCLHVLILLQL